MRVTQGIMYNSFVSNMNRTLGDYMESNIQSSSQKRVNRPSDDPVAAGRIMSSRATLNKMETWKENIDTAYGWLSLGDQVLGSGDGSVQSILSRLKVLAEQGASGDKTADNRLQISFEIREHFEQLINISNSEFQGMHIFAGHKTGQPAYVEGLSVTALDTYDYAADGQASFTEASFHVEGALARTMIMQPITNGQADSVEYRFSMDGGSTWQSAGTPALDAGTGRYTIVAGGVKVHFDAQDENGRPYMVQGVPPLGDATSPPDNPHSKGNGTWLYVRPTAIYQGDDHENLVSQTYKPTYSDPGDPTRVPTDFTTSAKGNFSRDVAVRLDKVEGDTLYYSYSTDDGSNWTQTSAPLGPANPRPTPLTLAVPGGYLTLEETPNIVEQMNPTDDPGPDAGTQFIIHPHRADIEFQIADNSTITVNTVGKEIFGGLYDDPTADPNYPTAVEFPNGGNLFEVVGRLIAAAETNSQQGMQQALDELSNVMDVVLTKTAEIGGRENRLTATAGLHLVRQYSEEDSLSRMEDADVTELMTRLAQQQVAYQSVLKSSSMIMQMSLVNFL